MNFKHTTLLLALLLSASSLTSCVGVRSSSSHLVSSNRRVTSTIDIQSSVPFGEWKFECYAQGEITDLSPSNDSKGVARTNFKRPQFILRGPELASDQFIEVSLKQPVLQVSNTPTVPSDYLYNPGPQIVTVNRPFGSLSFILSPENSQGDFPFVINADASLKKRIKETITVSQAKYQRAGNMMQTQWDFQGATLTSATGLKLKLRKSNQRNSNQWDQVVIDQSDLKTLFKTDKEVRAEILSTSVGPVIPTSGGSSGLSFNDKEIFLSPTVTDDSPQSGSLQDFKIFVTYETKLKESPLTFNGKINIKNF